MLTEEKMELANKVKEAYKGAGNGELFKWVGKTALQSRMEYPEWSTAYIESVHAIIMSVMCCMIENNLLTLKEEI